MYYRARYYDTGTGEFISQDPLEYVDGMSQYRAYFVPNGMDPSGRHQQYYPDFVGPLPDGGLRAKRVCTCTIPLQSGFNRVVVRYTYGTCSSLETVGLGTGRSSTCTEIVNPAPETFAACIANCETARSNLEKDICENKCKHRYRNRLNMCPSKMPIEGVPDSKGNIWTKDGPNGQIYHPGLDCFRSGKFQCCYECDGGLVTRGPHQGTYDYAQPSDWHDHWQEDMLPHWPDKNYYDDLTTIYSAIMSNPYDTPRAGSNTPGVKLASRLYSKSVFLSVVYSLAVGGFYLSLFFAANGIPSARKHINFDFFVSLLPLALIYGIASVAVMLPFILRIKSVSIFWYFAAVLLLLISAGVAFRFFCGFFTV